MDRFKSTVGLRPLTARAPRTGLSGAARVPGDKSISHRALMLGSVAMGTTRIAGLLEGEDVLATAAAMIAMGVGIERTSDGVWVIDGVGPGALAEPDRVLDLGNAGTACRLLMGLIAGHPITAFMTGDDSLRRRPMQRVAEPLRRMGARIVARASGCLPLAIVGTADPLPLHYQLPIPSAQVKSAILLAGLMAPGETSVSERLPTRDHTERMLRHFGATIAVTDTAEGRTVCLTGETELRATDIAVPSDPSSAAFALVAALLVPGSQIVLEAVGLNPLRTGLIDTLIEMGADIVATNPRTQGGEPVADLRVRHSALKGVRVPAERAPRMIDEYPILAVAAACAKGRSVMHGLGELRLKESDRLGAIAEGMAACGVALEVDGDTLIVEGAGKPPPGGAGIATRLDHRIAMAFAVLGQVTAEPVVIDDAAPIETSFPGFRTLMTSLGCEFAS